MAKILGIDNRNELICIHILQYVTFFLNTQNFNIILVMFYIHVFHIKFIYEKYNASLKQMGSNN